MLTEVPLGAGMPRAGPPRVLMSHAWSVPAALRPPPCDDPRGAQPHRRSWADGPSSRKTHSSPGSLGLWLWPQKRAVTLGCMLDPPCVGLRSASSQGLAHCSQPQPFGAAFTLDPQAQQQGGPPPLCSSSQHSHQLPASLPPCRAVSSPDCPRGRLVTILGCLRLQW